MNAESHGNLLRQCVLFGRLLRQLGVPVTPAQTVDLSAALHFIEIGRKQDFRLCAQAIFVSRREHLPAFDSAFDIFWRVRNADEVVPRTRALPSGQHATRSQLLRPAEAGNDGAEAESTTDRAETYSPVERLRHKDFATLDESELTALQQIMRTMSWSAKLRRSRRLIGANKRGAVDLRRTLRQNWRFGGHPIQMAYRRRKWKQRPLVLLCDISGSMDRYVRVLLQFLYTMTNHLTRVETFVFSTRLTRITRQLRHHSVDRALHQVTATTTDFGGGTRIGAAFHTFNRLWARRVLGQGAVVLIVSDGWDRGDVGLLRAEMARLKRNTYQVIWLNPLLGAPGYVPLVRGMEAALPYIDEFLPVHNLVSLEQLARVLEER